MTRKVFWDVFQHHQCRHDPQLQHGKSTSVACSDSKSNRQLRVTIAIKFDISVLIIHEPSLGIEDLQVRIFVVGVYYSLDILTSLQYFDRDKGL